MDNLKMISKIQILIFAVFVAATFGQKFCEKGVAVEVACPDGYLVTGVHTGSRIFNSDNTPECAKIADKVDGTYSSYRRYYYNPRYDLVEVGCERGSAVSKYRVCLVNGDITETETDCHQFKDGVAIDHWSYTDKYRPSRSLVDCDQRNSFLQEMKLQLVEGDQFRKADGSNVRVSLVCVIIQDG